MYKLNSQSTLWELEYIKCRSISDFEKYIEKFKDSPENEFVPLAEKELQELRALKAQKDAKKADKMAPKKNSQRKFNVKAVSWDSLKSIGYYFATFAACVFVASMVYSWVKKDRVPQATEIHLNAKSFKEIVGEDKPLFKSSKPTNSPITVPQPGSSFPSSQTTQTSERTDNDDMRYWNDYYTSQYANMTRQAVSAYNSLTNLGISLKDEKSFKGTTGRNDSYVVTQLNEFNELKRRMRDLRLEASRKGINILPSDMENATVRL